MDTATHHLHRALKNASKQRERDNKEASSIVRLMALYEDTGRNVSGALHALLDHHYSLQDREREKGSEHSNNNFVEQQVLRQLLHERTDINVNRVNHNNMSFIDRIEQDHGLDHLKMELSRHKDILRRHHKAHHAHRQKALMLQQRIDELPQDHPQRESLLAELANHNSLEPVCTAHEEACHV